MARTDHSNAPFLATENTVSATETESGEESAIWTLELTGVKSNAGARRLQCPHVGCRPASLRVLRPIGLAIAKESAQKSEGRRIWKLRSQAAKDLRLGYLQYWKVTHVSV